MDQNLWINSLKFYTVCFYCMPNWGLSKCIEAKLRTTCFYLIKSLFKKQKESLELVSLSTLFPSAWFLKENIYLFIVYYLTKFHCMVEMHASVSKDKLKELLLLSTQNGYFTFEDNIYEWKGGAAMLWDLHLGPC